VPLELRLATNDDLLEVASLLAELGYTTAAEDVGLAATLDAVLSDPERRVWIATNDGAVLGMISLSVRPQLRLAGPMLTVEELVVRASSRGSGVGTRLLDLALEEASRVGARRVELLTNRARDTYRRGFYQARGFVEVDSAVMRRPER